MVNPIWVYDPNKDFPYLEYLDSDDPDSINTHVFPYAYGGDAKVDNKADMLTTYWTETSMPPGGVCVRAKTENEGHIQFYYKAQRPSGVAYYESWRQKLIRTGVITEAEWPLGHFNRFRFFFQYDWNALGIDPANTQPGAEGFPSGEILQVGGYIARDDEPSGTGGQETQTEYYETDRGFYYAGHTYHSAITGEENIWHQVIVDPKPVHNRHANAESPYHHRPYVSAYPDHGYMDVFRDFYIQRSGNEFLKEGHTHYDLLLSGIQVFRDDDAQTGAIADEQNLVDYISGLTAQYLPVAGIFYIGICCRRAVYTVQCRYSFTTTYGQSFDSLTPLPQHPEITTNGDSYEQYMFRETINWGANPVVYLAFRVKENPEWGHREIAVCTDPSQFPPLPGETLP